MNSGVIDVEKSYDENFSEIWDQ